MNKKIQRYFPNNIRSKEFLLLQKEQQQIFNTSSLILDNHGKNLCVSTFNIFAYFIKD